MRILAVRELTGLPNSATGDCAMAIPYFWAPGKDPYPLATTLLLNFIPQLHFVFRANDKGGSQGLLLYHAIIQLISLLSFLYFSQSGPLGKPSYLVLPFYLGN